MAKVSMQRSVGRVRAACTLGVLSSGAPPHQLNRRRYGAGTFKFGVPGLASGRESWNRWEVQAPDSKPYKLL